MGKGLECVEKRDRKDQIGRMSPGCSVKLCRETTGSRANREITHVEFIDYYDNPFYRH
jgi:hypothetical protein